MSDSSALTRISEGLSFFTTTRLESQTGVVFGGPRNEGAAGETLGFNFFLFEKFHGTLYGGFKLQGGVFRNFNRDQSLIRVGNALVVGMKPSGLPLDKHRIEGTVGVDVLAAKKTDVGINIGGQYLYQIYDGGPQPVWKQSADSLWIGARLDGLFHEGAPYTSASLTLAWNAL